MGKLHINLLGTSFTIQAEEDTEYLEKLLGYYKRITDDISKMPILKNNPTQISILSGIMLCDELYREKEKKVTAQTNTTTSSGIGQISIAREDGEEAERLALGMIQKLDKVL